MFWVYFFVIGGIVVGGIILLGVALSPRSSWIDYSFKFFSKNKKKKKI